MIIEAGEQKMQPNTTTTFTVVSGRDGGVAIYEPDETGEQAVVFAGNVKEATEYFGARASNMVAKDVLIVPPGAGKAIERFKPLRPISESTQFATGVAGSHSGYSDEPSAA